MCMMCAQVGGRVSGKTSIVRTLAQLVGQKLVEFPMNSDTDTTELLGGFQQVCVINNLLWHLQIRNILVLPSSLIFVNGYR